MGVRRIRRDLVEQDIRVRRMRVTRLMQEDGLKARVRKRLTCTTTSDHGRPVADNVLDRGFAPDDPRRNDAPWLGAWV
jgi:transposase InsO family protein